MPASVCESVSSSECSYTTACAAGIQHASSEAIQVVLRIRPSQIHKSTLHGSASNLLSPQGSHAYPQSCLKILKAADNASGLSVRIMPPPSASQVQSQQLQSSKNPGETFTYNDICDESCPQISVFEKVGKLMAENCLEGYHGTIFAYGQTGSGKTYTMLGPQDEISLLSSGLDDRVGLIPRILTYLFERIQSLQEQDGWAFTLKCSMIEIYNENIFDLLEVQSPACSLREDAKRGIFVYGSTEKVIANPTEALRILEIGAKNRTIASTSMNRESSRSHTVFTIYIQSRITTSGGITNVKESRFNMVDLAGSERQQLTGTTGVRLKEAGNINKSLLALSNVMNALVDIHVGTSGAIKSSALTRAPSTSKSHVRYRDSKLTFLLKDSLGGNAKTIIIANVSSHPASYNETLSTLKFAQRAKLVKNKAKVNSDIVGSMEDLQLEIERLKAELMSKKETSSPPPVAVVDGELHSLYMETLQRSAATDSYISDIKKELLLLQECEETVKKQLEMERATIRSRDAVIDSLKGNSGIKKQKTLDGSSSSLVNICDEVEMAESLNLEAESLKTEIMSLRGQLDVLEKQQELMIEWKKGQTSLVEKSTSPMDDLQKERKYSEGLKKRLCIVEKALQSSGSQGLVIVDLQEEVKKLTANYADADLALKLKDQTIKRLEVDIQTLMLSVEKLESEKEASLSQLEAYWSQRMSKKSGCEEALNARIVELTHNMEKLQSEKVAFTLSVENNYIRKEIYEEIKEKHQQLFTERSLLKSKFEKSRESLEKAEAALLSANEKLDTLQRERANAVINQGDIGSRWESFEELLRKSKVECESLQVRNEQNLAKMNALSEQIAALEAQKAHLSSQIYDMKLEKAKDTDLVNKELSLVRQENVALGSQLTSLKNELSSLQSKHAVEITTLNSQILQKNCMLSERANTPSDDFSRSIEELNQSMSYNQELLESIKDLKLQLSTSNDEQTRANEAFDRVKSEVTALKGELEALALKNKNQEILNKQLEFSVQEAAADNEDLLAQLAAVKAGSQIPELEKQISLCNAEIESLKNELYLLKESLVSVEKENNDLVQHQKFREKLQYYVKIKKENSDLMEENARLKDRIVNLEQLVPK